MKPEIKNSVGFSGTREGMTTLQKQRVEWKLRELWRLGFRYFHHGDCVGADEQAVEIARKVGYWIVRHPPEDESMRAHVRGDVSYPPAPYLDRNRGIVNQTTLLVAAPKGPERLRSGTWATVRYARETDKPVYLV